jgi:hypothetical protein
LWVCHFCTYVFWNTLGRSHDPPPKKNRRKSFKLRLTYSNDLLQLSQLFNSLTITIHTSDIPTQACPKCQLLLKFTIMLFFLLFNTVCPK